MSCVVVRVFLCLLVFVGVHQALSAPSSPPDTDNEIEKASLADTLTKLFDLPQTADTFVKKHAPPEYMVTLYNQVATPDGLPRPDGSVPHGAKVIRSFEMLTSENVNEKDPVTGSRLFFNVSGLSSREKLLEAELHLFKLKPLVSGHKVFRVQVYEVLNSRKLEDLSAHRKLDDKLTLAHGSTRWTVLRVSEAVQNWISGIHQNLGLLVVATSMRGKPIPIRVGFRHSKVPLLVLYDDEVNPAGVAVSPDLQSIAYKGAQRISWPSTASMSHNQTMRGKREAAQTATCERKDMHLNFEDIGLERIVSPTIYNAYWCSGTCSFPLGQEVFPTNHATVQSIAHYLGLAGGEIGKPCCVPSKLLAVSILFFDENGNAVLKQYDDMVAGECACH